MRALTICQPFAWAIIHGGKQFENRPLPAPAALYGQVIAIHAGLRRDYGELPGWVNAPPRYEYGAVIGVARLTGDVCSRCDAERLRGADAARWFVGPHAHVFADPRPLVTPVPCRGMLGYWTLPAEVERLVLEQLARPARPACGCCERGDDYNGFGSDGPTTFTCPKGCACHD